MGAARVEGTPESAAAADAAVNAVLELGRRPETSLRIIDPSFVPQGPFDRDEAIFIADRRLSTAVAAFNRLVRSCTTHPADERRRDEVATLIGRFLDANRDVPLHAPALRDEIAAAGRRLRPADASPSPAAP